MSETSQSNRVALESIHWREAFPFTNLFRTFRLAIHPSKLILALVAVLICYFGGRFLDLLAGKRVVVEQPAYTLKTPADEIQQYIASATMTEFYAWREQALTRNAQQMKETADQFLKASGPKEQALSPDEALDNLESHLEKEQHASAALLTDRFQESQSILTKDRADRGKSVKDKAAADRQYEHDAKQLTQAADYLRLGVWKSSRVAGEVVKGFTPGSALALVIKSDPKAKDPSKAMEKARADREKIQQTINLANAYEEVKARQGMGVFAATLSYGILMFNSAVDSVLDLQFFHNPDFKSFAATPNEPPGLVRMLELTLKGLGWLVRVHWLYFIVYGLFSLMIWAVAGGAICRIAALHATRDEKIPFGEAFGFATRKFASFFTAPLMPVFFIIGCCLPLLLIGVVGAIPWFGEILVGLGFVLVLLISFALAITLIGGIGGVGLMYPTIAVEGSDTFDAFSRSYSYVYARPWRTIFYMLVAAVYGTLCFVFVKKLIELVFTSAAAVVGWPMNGSSAAYAAPLGKLQAMWFFPADTTPFFGRFFLFKLSATEALGSLFMAIWVFLLVGLVIAFAVSFFFCAFTIIYLLLRRNVDATELDEVYVEEMENTMAMAPVASTTTPTPTAPVTGAPDASASEAAPADAAPSTGPTSKPGPSGSPTP